MSLQVLTKPLTFDREASAEERARQWCESVQRIVENGDYKSACQALEFYCTPLGSRPQGLEDLDKPMQAEVLMRAGVLTGWIGSASQTEGALEAGKNHLSEAIRIFNSLEMRARAADAQTEIGFLYWRAGEADEARDILYDALAKLTDEDKQEKANALIKIATTEASSLRYHEALHILRDAAPLFNELESHTMRGRFHNVLGIVYKELGEGEERSDYIDLSMVAYTAAGFHFEQAGHQRFLAYVENNLGFLFATIKKYTEAHRHLTRARELVSKIGDRACVAQVDETRAQVYLMDDRFGTAEKVARQAVRALQHGDELGLLSEALTTHSRAMARMGRLVKALDSFKRASEVACRAGNNEQAGLANLALIEELAANMALEELIIAYGKADEHLQGTRNMVTLRRLQKCARLLREKAAAHCGKGAPITAAILNMEQPFCLKEEVLRYEGEIIKRAWDLTGGQLKQTTKLLGLEHHQTLDHILRNRHKDLLGAAFTETRRKRSYTGRAQRPQRVRR